MTSSHSQKQKPDMDEVDKALASRVLGEIRLGAKRFDAVVKTLRAEFDESIVQGLKPNFIAMWNSVREKYSLDEATPEGFDAAMTNTVDVDVEQATQGESQASGFPISDELAQALAKRTIGSIRLGIKQFDAFIKELRENLDDASVNSLKSTLISTWNTVRPEYSLDEATDAGFDAGMKLELEEDPELPVAMTKPPATPSKTLEAVPSDSPSKYLPPQPKPSPPSHSLKGDLLLNGSFSLDPETARLNEPETEVERRAHHPAIQRMGFPEWSFHAFQQLRRLVEDIREQPDPIPSREIPERLDKILAYFPASFVTYDDKIKFRVEELLRDFEEDW